MTVAAIKMKLTSSFASTWDIIKDFWHVHRWVDDVISIETTGTGIGSIRKLLLKDNKRVTEKLLELDDKHHIIYYCSVITELPFKNYFSQIQVQGIRQNCIVNWSSTFTPVGIDEKNAIQLLVTNYKRYLTQAEALANSVEQDPLH